MADAGWVVLGAVGGALAVVGATVAVYKIWTWRSS